MQHIDSIIEKITNVAQTLGLPDSGTQSLTELLNIFFLLLHFGKKPANNDSPEFQTLLMGLFYEPDRKADPEHLKYIKEREIENEPINEFSHPLLSQMQKHALALRTPTGYTERGAAFLNTTGTDLEPMDSFLFCALSISLATKLETRRWWENDITPYNRYIEMKPDMTLKKWAEWEMRMCYLIGIFSNLAPIPDNHILSESDDNTAHAPVSVRKKWRPSVLPIMSPSFKTPEQNISFPININMRSKHATS